MASSKSKRDLLHSNRIYSGINKKLIFSFLSVFIVISALFASTLLMYFYFLNKAASQSLISNQNSQIQEHRLRIHERFTALYEIFHIYLDAENDITRSTANKDVLSLSAIKSIVLNNRLIVGSIITDINGNVIKGVRLNKEDLFSVSGTLQRIYSIDQNHLLISHQFSEYYLSELFIPQELGAELRLLLGRRFTFGNETYILFFEIDAKKILSPSPFSHNGIIIITDDENRVITFPENQNLPEKPAPLALTLDEFIDIYDSLSEYSTAALTENNNGQLNSYSFSKSGDMQTYVDEDPIVSSTLSNLPVTIYVYLRSDAYYEIVRPLSSRLYVLLLSIVVIPFLLAWVITSFREEKKAKEVLRRLSEKHNRSLFEKSPIGLAIVESESLRIVDINNKLCSIFQIKNPPDRQYLLDEFLVLEKEQYNSLLAGKIDNCSCEKKITTTDGKIIWLSVTISLIEDLLNRKKQFLAAIIDITEVKNSRIILERFRAALDSSSDLIFIFDENGNLIDANMNSYFVLGYTQEELFQIDPKSLSPVFSKQALEEYLSYPETIQDSMHRSISSLTDSEGNSIHVELKFSRLRMEGKNYIVISAKDISWILRYEEELKQREDELSEAHSIAKIGNWEVDLEEKIYTMSESVSALFGKKIPQRGNGFEFLYSLVHPDDYRKIRNEIKTGKFTNVSDMITYRTMVPDGTIIWVEAVIRKVVYRGDKKPLLFGTLQDVSYRKENERLQEVYNAVTELIASDFSLDILYEKIHEVLAQYINVQNFYIALYDHKTGIISFPYFRDEYDDVFPDQQLGKSLSSSVITTGKPLLLHGEKKSQLIQFGQVQVMGTDSKVWLGVPLKVEDEIIGLMAVQDYHDESAIGAFEQKVFTFVASQVALAVSGKHKSDKLKEYSAQLLQSNKTKERLLSLLAHDLRSPYTSLLGMSEILSKEYDSLTDSERRSFINKLSESLHLQYDLVNNLLKWIMLQTDKIAPKVVSVDINQVVKDIYSIYKPAANVKGINLKTNLPKECFVYADKDMTDTILRNFVSNAVKFTGEGGSITISAASENTGMEITISDTGTGMSKEVLDKLFVQNSTYTSPGTNGEQGSGFGLVMIREMVEKMNGTLTFDSAVGKGTTFILLLPTKENA